MVAVAALAKAVAGVVLCWFLLSGFMWLQLVIITLIGEETPIDASGPSQERVNVALYTALGGIAWIVVFVFTLASIANYCCSLTNTDRPAVLRKTIRLLSAWLFVSWALLFAVSFQDPVGSMRTNRLRETGADRGGVVVRACYQEDAHALKVPESATWVYLAGDGWTVDTTGRSPKKYKEGDWTFMLAPIVYRGKLDSLDKKCAFDPPIYATCISKSPNHKNCRWEPFSSSKKGYTLSIRKTRYGGWYDQYERSKFPGDMSIHRMFDFDSESNFDTYDLIAAYESDEYHMRRRTMLIWVGVSIALAVVYFIAIRSDVQEDKVSHNEPIQAQPGHPYPDDRIV